MIEKISALIVDIDNTLVEKGKKIMPVTKEALIYLHEHGVKVGLASGRPVNSSMFHYAKDWDLPFEFDVLIGMNGGELWDCDHPEIVRFYPLSTEHIHQVIDLVKPLNMIAQTYENDMMVVSQWDNAIAASMIRNNMEVLVSPFEDRMYRHPNAKIQFRYQPERVKEVESFCHSLTLPEHVQCVSTSEGIIEFMDDRINKGVAVIEFAKRNQIAIDEVMAFGDLQNDNELLRDAGWGVCMQNGAPETKQFAKDVTENPVWDDGMGKYLNQHVIGKII